MDLVDLCVSSLRRGHAWGGGKGTKTGFRFRPMGYPENLENLENLEVWILEISENHKILNSEIVKS